ncbi:MAG TPA: hypothetical protein VNS63_24055 [Blastocatellia bacterium]|nr:hypothetical protein [Blastocatellia bacterium]
MYCSTCGIDSVEGLKYCKRCGANLTVDLHAFPQGKTPVVLTIAFLILIGGVFCVGLGLPIATAQDLARIFSTGDLMTLFLADLGLTLAIVAMLVWLLVRLIKVQQPVGPVRKAELPQIDSPRMLIATPPQSVGSVTENTTRTLEQRSYDARSESQ